MGLYLYIFTAVVRYTVAPQIGSTDAMDIVVVRGESVELTCNASGVPSPRVIWQKGRRTLAGQSCPGRSLTLQRSIPCIDAGDVARLKRARVQGVQKGLTRRDCHGPMLTRFIATAMVCI